MIADSINDEILRIKHELAEAFNNDVRRIAADARTRQRDAVSLPPRPVASWPVDSLNSQGNSVSTDPSAPAAG